MSPRPHSVPPPGATGDDDYIRRNDFLYLLLGLISTAESVLRVAPELVPAEPPAGAPSPAQVASGGLMR
jgi:hypothetical protein